MSLVRIQQMEQGEWKTLPLDDVQHTCLGVVVGGHFRILIEGKVVFDNREEGDVNPSPNQTTREEG